MPPKKERNSDSSEFDPANIHTEETNTQIVNDFLTEVFLRDGLNRLKSLVDQILSGPTFDSESPQLKGPAITPGIAVMNPDGDKRAPIDTIYANQLAELLMDPDSSVSAWFDYNQLSTDPICYAFTAWESNQQAVVDFSSYYSVLRIITAEIDAYLYHDGEYLIYPRDLTHLVTELERIYNQVEKQIAPEEKKYWLEKNAAILAQMQVVKLPVRRNRLSTNPDHLQTLHAFEAAKKRFQKDLKFVFLPLKKIAADNVEKQQPKNERATDDNFPPMN